MSYIQAGAAVIIVTSLGSLIGSAAQDSLPEMVRRQRAPVETFVLREFLPVGLPELVDGTDLIARVVVATADARLGLNQRRLESEYSARVLDVLFSRDTVQAGKSIVVRKPGGSMMVEG